MKVDVHIYYGKIGEPQHTELLFSTEEMVIRIPNLTFESCEEFVDDIKKKLHDAKAMIDAYEPGQSRYGEES